MTYKENIKAILECCFAGFKQEIIEGACNRILEIEPKTGHWILTDVERDRIWRCNCSECGKDILDYIYGSEEWWLTYGNLPKFCPTCGSRNF